jgi:selenide,water dikinase
MNAPIVRLTSLAHGGGCGCKLAPAVLQRLLAGRLPDRTFQQLLVGSETSDDAAVWQLDDSTCIVATTDFFLPIVDDPFDFGRIAATNAISDVYAMGAKPIMALAIVGMPIDKIAIDVVHRIIDGGASACAEAAIPVAGGHSIDSPEPIYGLAVIGTCRPDQLRRNGGARPDDILILTKPLGVGVYSAALKQGELGSAEYTQMLASTTQLNHIGAALGDEPAVHAMTDVTGFGLLGHALEMAKASELVLHINRRQIPFLGEAESLAQRGFVTGASHRNWSSYEEHVTIPAELPDWRRHLLTDPQTSGGLLVACAADHADAILARIVNDGFPGACVIGHTSSGPAHVMVET